MMIKITENIDIDIGISFRCQFRVLDTVNEFASAFWGNLRNFFFSHGRV